MIQSPIFMNHGEKSVHLVGDVLKVRRKVITHVNWLFAVAPTELRNIGNGRVVQRPERVFVEKLDPFCQPNLNTV